MAVPKKKTIQLICYGIVLRDCESPWEDVWVRYFNKRKKVCLAPTVMGRDDLEFTLAMERENIDKERIQLVEEEERILNEFKQGVKFAVMELNPNFPDLYINKPQINKKDIEEAVQWWLTQRGVLTTQEPRFRWNKPEFIVQSW